MLSGAGSTDELFACFLNSYPNQPLHGVKIKFNYSRLNLSLHSLRKFPYGSMHPSFMHNITLILRKHNNIHYTLHDVAMEIVILNQKTGLSGVIACGQQEMHQRKEQKALSEA